MDENTAVQDNSDSRKARHGEYMFIINIIPVLMVKIQLLAQLETLISLPPSAEHVTTPLAGFPPRLRIRQTIFRSEHGFEAIQRLLGVLTSTAALKTSVTGETEENTAAGELNVGDLTLDDATTTAGEGLESQDPTQQIATILRILHACLANHASRRHFDVSRAYERGRNIQSNPFSTVNRRMDFPRTGVLVMLFPLRWRRSRFQS